MFCNVVKGFKWGNHGYFGEVWGMRYIGNKRNYFVYKYVTGNPKKHQQNDIPCKKNTLTEKNESTLYF
jgi:hypothetical protein